MLDKIAERRKMTFTEEEKQSFSTLSSFGLPIANLKEFLHLKPEARNSVKQSGIPCDSLNNELGDWILFARLSNPKFRIAIKGDRESSFPVVKQVINTLQEKKVNKFNFITSLENAPE